MLSRISIVWILLNLLPLALAAQKHQVSGRVEDNTGSPIAFANVAMQLNADSGVVARAVTDDNGTFSFYLDALPASVTLHVSAIGFEDTIDNIQNTDYVE